MSGRAHRKRGIVPAYWWDFNYPRPGAVDLIVETDDPRCADGVVARIPYSGLTSIYEIERVLSDFQAGRARLEQKEGKP